MPTQSNSVLGEEQSPHLTASYAYVIENPGGERVCLCSWDKPITIEGLPSLMGTDDPQEFTPAPVRHGPVTVNDKFEQRTTSLSLTTEDTAMRRFFSTSAPVRLRAWIIRLMGVRLTDTQQLDYVRNCFLVESGIISSWSFRGTEIACNVTPEAFHTDRAIPRFYFERQCNHPLYGEGCGLDKGDFSFDTDIVSINAAQKEIVVTGQDSGVPETRFNSGHLFHLPTGLFFTIGWSAYDSGNTKFKLLTWHPEIEVGDNLTAYHGCRHNVEDCALFGNSANFGGFPKVPSSNPTINGVS